MAHTSVLLRLHTLFHILAWIQVHTHVYICKYIYKLLTVNPHETLLLTDVQGGIQVPI